LKEGDWTGIVRGDRIVGVQTVIEEGNKDDEFSRPSF